MLLTKLFSGLLAAVMVALGAGQIGNTNTPVGDEPVVEKTVLQEQPMYWYQTNSAGTHTDGSTPLYGTRSEVLQSECNLDDGIVCLLGSDDPDLPADTPVGTPTPDIAIFKAN